MSDVPMLAESSEPNNDDVNDFKAFLEELLADPSLRIEESAKAALREKLAPSNSGPMNRLAKAIKTLDASPSVQVEILKELANEFHDQQLVDKLANTNKSSEESESKDLTPSELLAWSRRIVAIKKSVEQRGDAEIKRKEKERKEREIDEHDSRRTKLVGKLGELASKVLGGKVDEKSVTIDVVNEFNRVAKKYTELDEIENALKEIELGSDAVSKEWAKRVYELILARNTKEQLSGVEAIKSALGDVDRQIPPGVLSEFAADLSETFSRQDRLSEIEKKLAEKKLGTDAERREWAKRIVELHARKGKSFNKGDLENALREIARVNFANDGHVVDEFSKELERSQNRKELFEQIAKGLKSAKLGNDAERREWAKQICDLVEDGEKVAREFDSAGTQIGELKTLLNENGIDGNEKCGAAKDVLREIHESRKLPVDRDRLAKELKKLDFVSESEAREWSKLIAKKLPVEQNEDAPLPEKLRELQLQLRIQFDKVEQTKKRFPTAANADGNDNQEQGDDACRLEIEILRSIYAISKGDVILLSSDASSCNNEQRKEIELAQKRFRDAQFVAADEDLDDEDRDFIEKECALHGIPFLGVSKWRILKEWSRLLELVDENWTAYETASETKDILVGQENARSAERAICEVLIELAKIDPAQKLPDLMRQFREQIEADLRAYSEQAVLARKRDVDRHLSDFKKKADAHNYDAVPYFVEKPDYAGINTSGKKMFPADEEWVPARNPFGFIEDKEEQVETSCKELEKYNRFWSDYLYSHVAKEEIKRIARVLNLEEGEGTDVASTVAASFFPAKGSTPDPEEASSSTITKLLSKSITASVKDAEHIPPEKVEINTDSTRAAAVSEGESISIEQNRPSAPCVTFFIPKPASWENFTWKNSGIYTSLVGRGMSMPAKLASGMFVLFAPFMLLGIDNPLKSATKGVGATFEWRGSLTLLAFLIAAYFLLVGVLAGKASASLVSKSSGWRKPAAIGTGMLVAVSFAYYGTTMLYQQFSGDVDIARGEILLTNSSLESSWTDRDEWLADSRLFAIKASPGWNSPIAMELQSRLNVAFDEVHNPNVAFDEVHNPGESNPSARVLWGKFYGERLRHSRKNGPIIKLYELYNGKQPDVLLSGNVERTDDGGNAIVKPHQFKLKQGAASALLQDMTLSELLKMRMYIQSSESLTDIAASTGWNYKNGTIIATDGVTTLIGSLQDDALREKLNVNKTNGRSEPWPYYIAPRLYPRGSVDGNSVWSPPSWLLIAMAVAISILLVSARTVLGPRSVCGLVQLLAYCMLVFVLGFAVARGAYDYLVLTQVSNDLVLAHQWAQDGFKDNSGVVFGDELTAWDPQREQSRRQWGHSQWTLGLLTEVLQLTEVEPTYSRPAGAPLVLVPTHIPIAVFGFFAVGLVTFFFARKHREAERTRRLGEANLQAKQVLIKDWDTKTTKAHENWCKGFQKSIGIWVDQKCQRLEFELSRHLEQRSGDRRRRLEALQGKRGELQRQQGELVELTKHVDKLQGTCIKMRQEVAKHLQSGGA